MNTQVVQKKEASLSAIENVLMKGDLSKLTEEQRLSYYNMLCESVGLNHLTQPFEYITLNNKLTLYTKKSATEQLRKIHGVSIEIVAREKVDDVYIVVARAKDGSGRQDEAIGAVNVKAMAGDALANAIMKCETKAKRRVTLSICGLAFLDESELPTVGNLTHTQSQDKALNSDKKPLPWEKGTSKVTIVETKQVQASAPPSQPVVERKDYTIPMGTLEGVKLSEKPDEFWVSYRRELREKLQAMPPNFQNSALDIIKHLDDYLAD